MKVTIDGANYPLPLDYSFRESQLMKFVTDRAIHAGTVYDAITEEDPGAGIAIAAVALKRAQPDLPWAEIKTKLDRDEATGSFIVVDFTPDATEGGEQDPLGPAQAGEQ